MDDVDLNVDVEEGTEEGCEDEKESGGVSPGASPAIAGAGAGGSDARMGALTGSQGVLSPPTFFDTSEVSYYVCSRVHLLLRTRVFVGLGGQCCGASFV